MNSKSVDSHCHRSTLQQGQGFPCHPRQPGSRCKVWQGHSPVQSRGRPAFGIPHGIQTIERFCARWIKEDLRYHEALPPLSSTRKHGCLKRRVGHDPVLLFVRDSRVPPANNLAKRALRPEKTRIKISGCHRSESGAHNRAVMMTVLGTAGKGWNL